MYEINQKTGPGSIAHARSRAATNGTDEVAALRKELDQLKKMDADPGADKGGIEARATQIKESAQVLMVKAAHAKPMSASEFFGRNHR